MKIKDERTKVSDGYYLERGTIIECWNDGWIAEDHDFYLCTNKGVVDLKSALYLPHFTPKVYDNWQGVNTELVIEDGNAAIKQI